MGKIKKDPATAKQQGQSKSSKYKHSLHKKQTSSLQNADYQKLAENDCKVSMDLLYLIERFETELQSSKLQLIKNEYATRVHNSYLTRLNDIKQIIGSKFPRFKWQIIQNRMDCLYRTDKSLTGYIIYFDFKQSKEANRGTINYFHNGTE